MVSGRRAASVSPPRQGPRAVPTPGRRGVASAGATRACHGHRSRATACPTCCRPWWEPWAVSCSWGVEHSPGRGGCAVLHPAHRTTCRPASGSQRRRCSVRENATRGLPSAGMYRRGRSATGANRRRPVAWAPGGPRPRVRRRSRRSGRARWCPRRRRLRRPPRGSVRRRRPTVGDAARAVAMGGRFGVAGCLGAVCAGP